MLSSDVLAGILTIVGTGLLYLSWARKSPVSSTVTTLSGWIFIAASFWPWMWSNGIEFAWPLLLFVPACGAWCWVLWHNRYISASTNISFSKKETTSLLPSLKRVGDSVGRLLLYIPFCGIISTWITLVFAKRLFSQDLDQGAFVVILTPLLWGLLAGWLLMSERLWRSTSIIAGIGAFCATLLYFTTW